ncbi:hypothetical protein ACFLS4_06325, partial [Bacteroidota bacterium]
MNLQTTSKIIEVDGAGQATKTGVEEFVFQMTEYVVGVEIGGAYFSNNGGDKTTHMTIGMYENNTATETHSTGQNEGATRGYSLIGYFHTHPSGVKDYDLPSDKDITTRNTRLLVMPNLEFILLHKPVTYNDKILEKTYYTEG